MSRSKLHLLGLVVACTLCASPALSDPRDGASLATAANASGRPRECAGPGNSGDRAWRPTIWDNARQPQLKRYCDLLGRAQSRLAQSPVAAREAATVADRILPGHAAPWVVMARASVLVQRFDDALKEFEKARTLDPRSVEEPQALHDLAIAQRQTGKLAEASATFRALVPRLSLLPQVQDRTLVLLEAASVAVALSEEGLREAVSLLSEARSYPASRYDSEVLALLALCLDRAGAAEQAAEVLQLLRTRGLLLSAPDRDATAYTYLVRNQDAVAMVALLAEQTEPKKAVEYWERFVARESNARWRDHARRHLEATRSGAQKRPKPGLPPAQPPARR